MIYIKEHGQYTLSDKHAYCTKCNTLNKEYDARCYDGVAENKVFCKKCRTLKPVYYADYAMPVA
jgi:hypothetical protein